MAAEITRPETSHSYASKLSSPVTSPAMSPMRAARTGCLLPGLRPIPYDPRKPNPLRMNPEELGRPFTPPSRRRSFSAMSSATRPKLYGQGKHMNTELVPQPTDDPSDPLVHNISVSSWSRPNTDRVIELAEVEEGTQLLCVADHGGPGRRHEDRVRQREQRHGNAILGSIHRNRGPHGRAPGCFCFFGALEQHGRCAMGEATCLSAVDDSGLHWLRLEHTGRQELCPVHGSASFPGSGLGRF